jgi:hypothetical protein
LLLANGWAGDPVRLCDVLQQALFAQHPGLHALSLGAFVKMHVAAGNRTLAATRASPTAKVAMSLLSIGLICSTIVTLGRVQSQRCADDGAQFGSWQLVSSLVRD